MQTTESGRKLGQAMTSTGRAVATTSKAVGKYLLNSHQKYYFNLLLYNFLPGGAISQAKGAFSSWWNNLLISPEPGMKQPEAEEIPYAEDLTFTDAIDNSSTIGVEINHTNIPNSIKDNGVTDSDKVSRDEQISCGDKTVESHVKHQPGEVHTV